MKISVQIKIVNNEKKLILNRSNRSFEIDENTSSIDLKNLIKTSIAGSDQINIVEEILYSDNKKLDDSSIVPLSSRLEYKLLF